MLVILVLLCAGAAQTSPGHSVLVGLGLTETPPSYTELSFASPDGLQQFVASVQAPVTVSFGIHNVSGSSKTYRWSVVALHNGANVGSSAGNLPVAAQGSASFTTNVQVTCPSGRIQMVLKLADPAESLNFWVACPASAGPAKKGGAK